MDTATRRLADYAVGARLADHPPALTEQALLRLLDTLGCALAAFDDPLCVKARAVAQRQSGEPGATVWGTAWRSTPEAAAFANGVMLRFLDLSDAYRLKSGGHPSDVIAAVLAVAEAVGAPGATLLEGIAVAYEIYCSFCDAIDANTAGWDKPVYGTVACAAGAARVMGLDRDTTAEAIALALAPNMALMQTRRGHLSAWKGCAAANGARNGVFAAFLARDGFTGPTAVIEGKAGLWDVLGRFHWAPGSAMPHRLLMTNLKRRPLCYHGQSAAQAALDLAPRVAGGRIEAVRVGVYAQAFHEMASDPSRWAPTTRETADHSLPHVVATALLRGRIGLDSFDDAHLADAALRDLTARVQVEEVAELSARYPRSAPARIEIRMADGTRHAHEVASPRGHADNPMTPAEVEAKFRMLLAGSGHPADPDGVIAALRDLPAAPDVSRLLRALAPR
jgi:2-methylcitrate dehydratase